MIWLSYPCEKDRTVFLVPKTDPQLSLLSVMVPCPRCLELLTVSENFPSDFAAIPIAAVDFFQASNGLGILGEQDASKIRVEHSVIGGLVRGVTLEEVSPQRSVILSMDIQGTDKVWRRFHFATSTKGATIFKVEVL